MMNNIDQKDYSQLLTLMESFIETKPHNDQQELLVDFLCSGLEEKERELAFIYSRRQKKSSEFRTVERP